MQGLARGRKLGCELLLRSGELRWAHVVCGAVVIVLSVCAAAWYCLEWASGSRLPGGSSRPGIMFGIVAGLIILFELALWPRRFFRAWRYLFSARHWMLAHIWLGLFSVPLVVLHSGFSLGGWLSTVLTLAFAVVIASGVFGLWLQHALPRRLLERVPQETIYAQIEHVRDENVRLADTLMRLVCGAAAEARPYSEILSATLPPAAAKNVDSAQVVGAVRTLAKVESALFEPARQSGPLVHGESLLREYVSVIRPYLQSGRRASAKLASVDAAKVYFTELKRLIPDSAEPSVDLLDGWCRQRAQLDEQSRMHAWLHGWLAVHLPLSVGLVALLVIHVFQALRYW